MQEKWPKNCISQKFSKVSTLKNGLLHKLYLNAFVSNLVPFLSLEIVPS